jgi:hypothetical protein
LISNRWKIKTTTEKNIAGQRDKLLFRQPAARFAIAIQMKGVRVSGFGEEQRKFSLRKSLRSISNIPQVVGLSDDISMPHPSMKIP